MMTKVRQRAIQPKRKEEEEVFFLFVPYYAPRPPPPPLPGSLKKLNAG